MCAKQQTLVKTISLHCELAVYCLTSIVSYCLIARVTMQQLIFREKCELAKPYCYNSILASLDSDR